MDLDAHPVRLPGVRPHDRVVADDAARRVIQRRHDRERGAIGQVELRAERADLVGVDHAGVDAQEAVHLGALVGDVHRALGMSEREVALLREQQVVVELLREVLVQPERLLVEGHALGRPVVGADDRGVATRAAGADVVLLQDRDLRDAALRELVSDREPVGAAADDHDVVRRLQLGATPHPPRTEVADRVHRYDHPSPRSARQPTGAPPARRTASSTVSHAYRANSVAT
jgi:hypothetical protein